MRARRIIAGAVALAALAPAAGATAATAATNDVTVMTRNIYLGADIFRPVNETSGKSGLEALNAFANANAKTRKIVDQTSFPTRARLLAREMASRKPDLVGLQEVALWRSGPYSLANLGKATVTTVDYDFLKTLQAALKTAGVPYDVVRKQQEADVEGPAYEGNDPNADPNRKNVRLTMFDVILKRKASKVKVTAKGSTNYKAKFAVSLSGIEFAFVRGYTWADAKLGKKKFRFINTHLESARSDVALAQANELLASKAKGKRTTIVACDCNSDPLDATRKENDVPHYSAYRSLTKSLTDQWLKFAPASKGFTSGLSETVNDANLNGIDHRIDLILARNAKGKALKTQKAWVVGNKLRTSNGLWASDHMGVAARLRLP
jgi:endonuclease/exonuclease/phosphatase family metal-dependent hydrolase